ncbi:inactive leucine-rich repeat receptor protein kinase [Spatholobus suberectus]|nr:inactive leucine-rich repeat receptor protein kinase [Spatholobus suberectus]
MLSVFMVGHGVDSDISCLRSIKDSLEDPFKYLSDWNFNNKTEGFICMFFGVQCWHPYENRVLNLKLSNMGLKGQFPRGLQNCSSLTGLDLSLNELTGPIPSDISTLLPFVTTLDLSWNKFSGEIPATLGNCTYLNNLKLDNNMLSGHIPQELGQLPKIKSISFANNHLSGPVPSFLRGSTHVDYANNGELCGGPLPPCPLDRSNDFPQSFKEGLLVGYAFSVTSVIVIYMSYCAPWEQSNHKRNKHRNKAKKSANIFVPSLRGRRHELKLIRHTNCNLCSCKRKLSKRYSLVPTIHLSSQISFVFEILIFVLTDRMKSTMRFSEVKDATNCFSIDNAIGMGKIGITYKGKLPNGWNLAIKRLFDCKQFKRQFLLEIRILGKYRHINIVPLLGFCAERNERILVYQYMSNGRLSKWLNPLENEVGLKWPQRIKIALGVARGLSWLHHTCNLHVVHLNISSECVLLDKNFEPKISNFGQAKFMNPNIDDSASAIFYVGDGKKDVYDFGSLLFELITRKTLKELSRSSYTTNLSGNPSNYYNAIDDSLIGEGFENEVYTLIKVACQCVQPFPDERPTMLEVYNNMINIWGGQHRFSNGSDALNISVSFTSTDEIVEL